MAQKILGLDIGSFSVKAALFEATFRDYKLTDLFESAPLKLDEIDPIDQQPIITEAILRIIQDNQLSPSTVVIAVSGTETSTKELTLPLPPAQVEKVLPFELENFLPFELHELIIDYHIISSSKVETRLLSAAALKTSIQDKLKIVQSAGLEPAFIGLDSASLYNLFLMDDPLTDPLIGIIDIGHMKTSICFIKEGNIHHVRSLFKGGFDLTEAIRLKLDLTFDQAVDIKHQHAIIELPDQPLRSQDLQRLSSAIKQPIEDLANETLQTINAYIADIHAENPDINISKLYLTGGTSLIKNLPEYFSQATGIPCELYQLAQVQIERSPVFSSAVALGLRASIRGAKAKKLVAINFRKDEFSLARDMSGIKAIGMFFGKWIVAIFSLAILFQSIKFYDLMHERRKIENQILQEFKRIMPDVKNAPKTGAAALKVMNTKIQEYRDKQQILTAGLGSLTALSILREVSQRIPPEIQIDTQELSVDRNKVTIRATTDSFESVDKIIASLAEFEDFKKIDKGDIKETPEGRKLFTLNITIGADNEAEKPRKAK